MLSIKRLKYFLTLAKIAAFFMSSGVVFRSLIPRFDTLTLNIVEAQIYYLPLILFHCYVQLICYKFYE